MTPLTEVIIVDTEGKPEELSEIAIVDGQGQLIYEGFVQGHLSNDDKRFQSKPLTEILDNFLTIAHNKLIVCHFAKHDIAVLKTSCQKAGIPWPSLNFVCSYELAKNYCQGLPSHSLEYLSRHFNFKIDHNYFNPNFAHAARYDAAFTYQLYLKLRPHIMRTELKDTLQHRPNPFATNRVDTPFQNHIDLPQLYQAEADLLKSILTEIKQDHNQQSKGVVVIGEAGSGKTHLMMRLAKGLLDRHRLLFIRQPNHPDAVLYHTYSRMLESLVETIPHTDYSQIEYLLAKSFSHILIETLSKKTPLTQRTETILTTLTQDSLNIYKVFGKENTEKKRENWQFIEKHTLEWWGKTYGGGGYAASIIKGLIKFCRYSDVNRRDLVRRWLAGQELDSSELEHIDLANWSEDLSREEFALEAMAVLGKLSIKDEPLIIIFDQLEGLIYQDTLLLRFGEALKELFTHVPNSLIILNLFPQRWDSFQQRFDAAMIDRISQNQVILPKPSEEKLKHILQLRLNSHQVALADLFTDTELQTILSQPAIRSVLNTASSYYRHHVFEAPLPTPASHSKEVSNLFTSTSSFEVEIREEIRRLKEEVALLKNTLPLGEATLPQADTITSDMSIITPAALVDENTFIVEYLQQQRVLLEQDYDKPVIITDSDDLGKLITITQSFQTIRPLQTDYLRLGKKKLPEHLLVKTPSQGFVIGFLQNNGLSFTTRLKNFNELVVSRKDLRFGLFRDQRLSPITGKVGKEEIDKLTNASNGKFLVLEKAERLDLEVMYKLIVAIQNQDVEVPLETALHTLEAYFSHHWLLKILKKG
jgi:DNA polymerase III epsilon subunit-like protein